MYATLIIIAAALFVQVADSTQAISRPVADILRASWGMYLLGYLGFLARVMWAARKMGTRVNVLGGYIVSNSLIVLYGIITYTCLVGVWLFSNLTALLVDVPLLGSVIKAMDMKQGMLNGSTILLAAGSDFIWKYATRAGREEIKTAVKRMRTRVKKSDDSGPTPPPAVVG